MLVLVPLAVAPLPLLFIAEQLAVCSHFKFPTQIITVSSLKSLSTSILLPSSYYQHKLFLTCYIMLGYVYQKRDPAIPLSPEDIALFYRMCPHRDFLSHYVQYIQTSFIPPRELEVCQIEHRHPPPSTNPLPYPPSVARGLRRWIYLYRYCGKLQMQYRFKFNVFWIQVLWYRDALGGLFSWLCTHLGKVVFQYYMDRYPGVNRVQPDAGFALQ